MNFKILSIQQVGLHLHGNSKFRFCTEESIRKLIFYTVSMIFFKVLVEKLEGSEKINNLQFRVPKVYNAIENRNIFRIFDGSNIISV
jgi:hypothetical protein